MIQRKVALNPLCKRLFAIMAFFLCLQGHAQNNRQKQLEAQRKKLEQEIKQINKLLFSNRKEKQSALTEVENLDQRIRKREQLIRMTNEQANWLTRQINANQRSIDHLREELTALKEEYAEMVVRSHKSRSQQSRLMFLLSSQNFLQAYKRVKYLKKYADHRKKQGEEIGHKTLTLQELNKDLLAQKKEKELLVKQNRTEKDILEKEREDQQVLVSSLRKQESTYAREIRKKEREADRLDREIQRLIREAMAASNKGTDNNSLTFALTPEKKLLAANFTANKGSLPWPVREGLVVQGFGKQRHPVVRTVTIQSNGVKIATNPGERVRSVFDGEVMAILSYKGSNTTVLIQHGNYITSYKNLTKVSVKKGDTITSKQEIGEVFIDSEGKSVFQFSIFRNASPQDPTSWIYKM